jgi:tetratricopeptide (TPR) repeat protein
VFFRFVCIPLVLAASLSGSTFRFEDARLLLQQGKVKEARELLKAAASEFSASGDQKSRARALSMASRLSLSLGEYRAAISDAETAAAIRRGLKDDIAAGEDLNTLGSANLYLGNYGAALSAFQKALDAALAHGDAEAAITRQNNIGNVWYFQGRYSDAFRAYQIALDKVNTATAEKWYPRRRQLTFANLAALYQRLGQEQEALELYRQLASSPQAMPASEQAQLLLNQGVLFRRLGDPVKAMGLYRAAQAMFRTERHRDGEISALRSVGLALAMDLNDLPGAERAFTASLQLAEQSFNTRGIVQATLYREEVLRRLHRFREAERDATDALEAARRAGLAEEQWQAQYALGKLAEQDGRSDAALDFFQASIATIESLRSGLGLAMRNEYLADKREVYDSMIALRLRETTPQPAELFSWIERSRARTLLDRVGSASGSEPGLSQIQSSLKPDTVLMDFWVGAGASATLWITRNAAAIVRNSAPSNEFVSQFLAALQESDDQWKGLSRSFGDQLLAGVPLRDHVIVVPDGLLGAVPFEVLGKPGSPSLLIENHDITYLPSAQFVLREPASAARWLPPWRTQLVAFGDPPVEPGGILYGAERWQRLTASAGEVAGVAHLLPGRSEIHVNSDARKRYLQNRGVEGVPLVHFSTHAVVDDEYPDRSRILLAADSPSAANDYLFEAEVYDLNLNGVDLATVSACDTARGKLIRGEGIEAFSRAFLAAGSAATITSLWRVPDQPTADFMTQLYYYIAQGQSKAAALQSAKSRFLRSKTALAHPRYWAAFVLNGDGWNPSRRVIPWRILAAAVLTLLSLGAWGFRWVRRRLAAER